MLSSHIGPILLVSGIVTAGAIVLFVAPRPVSRVLFGIDISDSIIVLLVRHWGLLVFLVALLFVAYLISV